MLDLANISLSKVKKLDQILTPGLRKSLSKLYRGSGLRPHLATILNAVFNEHKFTFYLSHSSMINLMKKDANLTPELVMSFSELDFQKFLFEAEEGQFLNSIKKLTDGAHLLTLTHPALLSFFTKKLGADRLYDQKAYVLSLYKAELAFELAPTPTPAPPATSTPAPAPTLTPTPRQSMEQMVSETLSYAQEKGLLESATPKNVSFDPHVDPVAMAKQKAQKFGLLKMVSTKVIEAPSAEEIDKTLDTREIEVRIQNVESELMQEQTRYQGLLTKAREEDEKRLALRDADYKESLPEEEKMTIIRKAVEAGIQAQRQKRSMEDVELRLETLKEGLRRIEEIKKSLEGTGAEASEGSKIFLKEKVNGLSY